MLEILNEKDPNIVGVILLFAAVFLYMIVYSTEEIKEFTKKITLHNIATLVVFPFFFFWGLLVCIKCLFDEPSKRTLIFFRKYILWENITTYGMVYSIDQYDEPIYCSAGNKDYFPSLEDLQFKQCCTVKIIELRPAPKIISMDLDESEDKLNKEFKLTLLSKCVIKYRTWWWTGQHMFFKKIQPIIY